MPAKTFTFEPSTIETIDTGLYEWIDEKLNLKTNTNQGLKKVPVIWLGTERAYQVKNNKELRDTDGRIKLPVITVNRDSITKDPTFKGNFQAHLYENSDHKGGVVTIYKKKRINQVKSRNITNARKSRAKATGDETGRDRTFDEETGEASFINPHAKGTIYQEISIPVPSFITIMYDIVIKTEYQQQMNDLVPPFIAHTGLINSFFFQKDQYKYEAFIEQEFSPNKNTKELNEDERSFETTIRIKVLGYLIGEGANREKPKVTVRENLVRVKMVRERVIVGDLIEWADDDNGIRDRYRE